MATPAKRSYDEDGGVLPQATSLFTPPPAEIAAAIPLEAAPKTTPTVVPVPKGNFTENGWDGPQEVDW